MIDCKCSLVFQPLESYLVCYDRKYTIPISTFDENEGRVKIRSVKPLLNLKNRIKVLQSLLGPEVEGLPVRVEISKPQDDSQFTTIDLRIGNLKWVFDLDDVDRVQWLDEEKRYIDINRDNLKRNTLPFFHVLQDIQNINKEVAESMTNLPKEIPKDIRKSISIESYVEDMCGDSVSDVSPPTRLLAAAVLAGVPNLTTEMKWSALCAEMRKMVKKVRRPSG